MADVSIEPKIKIGASSQNGDKDKKRGGMLAPLLAKLGLGSAAGGAQAVGGAGAAVGGGMLLTKTGLVALILAGSSVAAGIGMLVQADRETAGSRSGVFLKASEASLGDTMSAAAGAVSADAAAGVGSGANGASSSLDYLNQANKGSVSDPTKAGEGEAVASSDAPAAVSSGVEAPDHGNGGANVTAAAVKRPPMVKNKGFDRTSSKTSQASLTAQVGLSGGIGGGFQQIAKPAARTTPGTSRARSGAQRTSAVARGSSSASRQLVNTNKVMRGAARNASVSSAGAGTTYDGGGRGGGSGIGAASTMGTGGAGAGGEGISRSPNASTVQNLREVPEPPQADKGKDKTPYKQSIKKAMIASAIAGIALLAASMLKKSADAAPLSPDYAGKLAMVKILAAVALAASAVVILAGINIMNSHGQQTQGFMFLGIGGILAFQSARVLYDSFAGDKAQEASNARLTTDGKAMQSQLGVQDGSYSTKAVGQNPDGSYRFEMFDKAGKTSKGLFDMTMPPEGVSGAESTFKWVPK